MSDEKHATSIAMALADAYADGVAEGHAYAEDELRRLRAEVERLRAALAPFADWYYGRYEVEFDWAEAVRAAAAALKDKSDG